MFDFSLSRRKTSPCVRFFGKIIMDKNAFDQLKSALKSITVEKDEIIFKEGDQAGDGYILSLGEVVLLQKGTSGNEVQKQKIKSMQVFGIWNSIFESEFRLFTAKAIEKSSLLVIPKATLEKKLKTLDPFLRFCFRQAIPIE